MSNEMNHGLYEILDDRFRTGRCANGDVRLEKLHGDCRWAEGPVYLPAWRPRRTR
ncbi:SMP-30/gluconolactonase/LRE family protein, partial [Kitasatospora sp. NPDC007106]